MYSNFPVTVFELFQRQGIIKVFGINRINSKCRYLPEIATCFYIGLCNLRGNFFCIGFNLFRSTNPDGKRVRLNADLIPSKAPGGIIGASYEYLDKDVQAGQKYYYWLEFIDTQGKTVYGPRQVKATHGLFMPAIFH